MSIWRKASQVKKEENLDENGVCYLVDVDLGDMSIATEEEPTPNKIEPVEEINVDFSQGIIEEDDKVSDSTALVVLVDEDLGGTDLAEADNEYHLAELERQAQPLIREATKHAVSEAIKFENAKVNVEVQDVLQEEVSYRLDKYERKRNRRKTKNLVKNLVKWGMLTAFVIGIYNNIELRTRISILAIDVKELVVDLVRGEDTSSNQLVNDLFRELDEEELLK